MEQGPAHASFWKHLRSEAPVVVALTVVTVVVHHFGFLQSFETASLDTWLRIKQPVVPQYVRVVAITEEDFKNPKLFGGHSPLDKGMLLNLIAGIAAGHPAVIAVDIDTSDPEWKDIDTTGFNDVPIVWAQDFIKTDKGEWQPLGVLGGTAPPHTGVAAMLIDWDGIVRHYRRVVETRQGSMDSFPWATMKVAVQKLKKIGAQLPSATLKTAERDPGEEKIALNFAADRYTFAPIRAGHVIDIANAQEAGSTGWANGPLKGKVVLLGQEHHATRDDYMTPVGMKSGLQIVAQTVENELQDREIRYASHFLMIVFDLLGSVLIIAFQFYLPPRPAFWLSLFAIPVVALIGSYVAFSTLSYWASFVPVFLGVFLHQLHRHIVEYRRLVREVAASRTHAT